jgi:hypothetical protein
MDGAGLARCDAPAEPAFAGPRSKADRRDPRTTLFCHFLATLVFPNGELVLRRKDASSLAQFTASAGDSVAVPFWITGDHFMVGWGRVEALLPSLLFVATGLTGAGIKLAAPAIRQAGIKLEEDKAAVGAGGGGTLRIVPYVLHRLSFGEATEVNVSGIYKDRFPGKPRSVSGPRACSATIFSSRMLCPSISRT